MPFLPDNTALQQLINQSAETSMSGLGAAFDTAFKLRMKEQENAHELFNTLTKANPALAQLVVQNNPKLIKTLSAPPMAFPRKVEAQGPVQPGEKPPKAMPASPGAQVGEAFAQAAQAEGDKGPEAQPNEVRLALEHVQTLMRNASAQGVKVGDPAVFMNGYAKSILQGRLPRSEDLGVTPEELAVIRMQPEAKNLDALSELTRLWTQENNRPPTFSEQMNLVSMVLPGTDPNTIELQKLLRETQLKQDDLAMQLQNVALFNAKNGAPLTSEQIAQTNANIEKRRPVVDAIQRLDNVWDKLVTGDAATKKAMRLLIVNLMDNPETSDIAIRMLSGQFLADDRTFLHTVLGRQLAIVHQAEQTLQQGRQPRGGTGTPTSPAPSDEDESLKDIEDQGLLP